MSYYIGGRKLLDLSYDVRVLRPRCKGNLLCLGAYGLIKEFLIESVILLIVLAVCHAEAVVPRSRMH